MKSLTSPDCDRPVDTATGDAAYAVGSIADSSVVQAAFSDDSQFMATEVDKIVRIWALHVLQEHESAERFELTKPVHELGH